MSSELVSRHPLLDHGCSKVQSVASDNVLRGAVEVDAVKLQ